MSTLLQTSYRRFEYTGTHTTGRVIDLAVRGTGNYIASAGNRLKRHATLFEAHNWLDKQDRRPA